MSQIKYTKDLSSELTTATALSTLDGRYWDKLHTLANKFSEAGLQRGRLTVDVRYLLAFSEGEIIRRFNEQERQFLISLYQDFGPKEFYDLKKIEKDEAKGADVKAVEIYIKKNLQGTSLEDIFEMVRLALTSEDTTNIALMFLTQMAVREDYLPPLLDVVKRLSDMAVAYKNTAMLARTHGRAAQPTTFGKEMGVVARRVAKWAKKIYDIKLEGKLSGAVGNLSDHYSAFPDVDWIKFSEDFVSEFGLTPNIFTTQILPYDEAVDLFGKMKDANEVLIGLTQDMWRYISDDWILLKSGGISSVMPQKINPEGFERGEGALQIANNDLSFLRRKLPTSRLQRDLSNSLATRKFGDAFGYSILGYQNLLEGLNASEPDPNEMLAALRRRPEIISSMMQTVLRRAGQKKPYESLQELTRGKKLSLTDLRNFAMELEVDDETRQRLLTLDPETSYGIAPRIAERSASDANEIIDDVKGLKKPDPEAE